MMDNLNHLKKAIPFITLVALTIAFTCCKYNKPLKKELSTIWFEDQDMRIETKNAWQKYGSENAMVDSLTKIMRKKDSIHTVRVSYILDKYGWLGKDEVGKIGNNTLFLVIQHSDLKTQQKYLPMVRNAVKEGKSRANWLALLEDRVALQEGSKQIYGSQVAFNKETKINYVAPLEDPDNVDRRRKKMDLDPIAHYLKSYNIKWNVEEYKKQLPELELIFKEQK